MSKVHPEADAFASDYGHGLTKREYAAFLMMAALVPARGTRDGADLAKSAVRFADDLLAELAKEKPTN